MSERYTKLFSLPPDLYAEDSPLIVSAGNLLKDNQTGQVLVQLKFQNIGDRQIRALKISLSAFDSFGTALEGVPAHQYLDLCAERDQFFGSKTAIPLPSPETRSFICRCLCAVFNDGSAWTASEEAWVPLAQQPTLEQTLGADLTAQYRRDVGNAAIFQLLHDRDLWRCVCGAVNQNAESSCHTCRLERDILEAALDPSLLRDHAEAYAREQASLFAKRQEEETKRRARAKKRVIILLLTFLLLTAALAGTYLGTYFGALKAVAQGNTEKAASLLLAKNLTNKHDPELISYLQAADLQKNGRNMEASDAFAALGDYRDSAWRSQQMKSAYAEEAFSNKEYDLAIRLFDELTQAGYANAEQRKADATFLKAESLLNNSNFDAAIELFHSLAELAYPNAVQKELDAEYAKAMDLFATKNYAEAITRLESLVKKNYPEAEDELLAIRYEYAQSALSENDTSTAEAQLIILARHDFKDSKDLLCDVRYDNAMAKAKKGEYKQAITILNDLSRNNYSKADTALKQIYTKLTEQADDNMLDKALVFWKDTYAKTKSDSDYLLLLLAIHNRISNIAYTTKTSYSGKDSPWVLSTYFDGGSLEQFYTALKASPYSSKCSDQCYDEMRLCGTWNGSGYYFTLQDNGSGHITYNLPWFDFGDYYELFDHKITLYTKDGKSSKDLFRFTFVSDTEMKVYCYKDGKTYNLKKQG